MNMADAGIDPKVRDSQADAAAELRARELKRRIAQAQIPGTVVAQPAQPAPAPPSVTPQAAPAPPPAPPPAPQQTPPADPATMMSQNLATLMERYGEQSKDVQESLKAAGKTRESLLKPAIAAVGQQAMSPQPPTPKTIPEPPVHDAKPRQFLSTEGTAALQTIVAGIGSLVTSFAGLSAPVGALNALTGAMEGWAEGDSARVAKEWQKYEAAVNKLQRENSTAMQEWERARVQRSDDIGAAQALLQAKLAEAGLSDYAAQVAEKGFDRTGALVAMAQQQLHNYQTYENKILRDQLSFLGLQERMSTGKLTRELLREKIEASKKGMLDDQTLHAMAEQYITGDTSVKQNIGRGIQGPENIAKLNTMIYSLAQEKGLSPQEIAANIAEFQGMKAGERVLGGRVATFGMAQNEASQMADLVVQASAAVPRTQFMPINRALLAYNTATGDPETRQFGAALNSYINAYGRAISPTGVPTVSDKDHAREMLSTADSHKALVAIMDQLGKEIEAAGQAPGKVRSELRSTVAPKPTTPTKPPSKKPTVDELLEKYK